MERVYQSYTRVRTKTPPSGGCFYWRRWKEEFEAIKYTNADLKEITDGTATLNKEDLDFAGKVTIADLRNKIDTLAAVTALAFYEHSKRK